MIVRYLTSYDVFDAISSLDTRDAIFVTKNFLYLVSRYGHVIIQGKFKELIPYIKRLPIEVRKEWAAFFTQMEKNNRIIHRPQSHQTTFVHEEDLSKIDSDTDLLVVPIKHFQTLGGLEHDNYFQKDHPVSNKPLEICAPEYLSISSGVKKAIDSVHLGFHPEETPQVIWEKWFDSMASISKNIVIVDRYLITNSIFIEDKKLSGPQRFSYGNISVRRGGALETFLKLLEKSIKNYPNVTIYSARLKDMDDALVNDIFCKICRPFKDSKINSIKLHVVDNRRFTDLAHGRFFRFDDIGTTSEKGMEIFEEGGGRQQQLTASRFLKSEKISTEQDLLSCGSRKTFQLI
jgi:hypothetical protein